MIRKTLIVLASFGLVAPSVAFAAARPTQKVVAAKKAAPKAAPPAKVNKGIFSPTGLLPRQPTAQGGKDAFAKAVEGTTCDPRDSNTLELRELQSNWWKSSRSETAQQIANTNQYRGLVRLDKVNARWSKAELLAPAFQGVITRRAPAIEAAVEATYRHALQQAIAAVRLTTEAHASAKTKHEAANPKAGEYARVLYTGARRLIDAIENLRKFELKLPRATTEKQFIAINKALEANLNSGTRSRVLHDAVPNDRLGPTGTPMNAARLAFIQSAHALERYRGAVALLVGTSGFSAANRNGGGVASACQRRFTKGFTNLKNAIKDDLAEEESEEGGEEQ